MTPVELAAELGISDKTLRRLVRSSSWRGRAATAHVSLALRRTPPVARAFNEFSKWKRNDAAQRAASIELLAAPENGLLDDVHCLDVLDGLRRLKTNEVRVNFTVTSVPYPIVAVEYPHFMYDGNYPKWLDWMRDVFAAVYDLSGDGDRLAVTFDIPSIRPEDSGDPNKELRHKVDVDLYNVLTKNLIPGGSWVYRDEVCWYKQNAVSNRPMVGSFASASSPRVQRNWEPILIFHKGSRVRERGADDITTDEFNDWTIGHWDIKPETGLKPFHRCPFPLEIPRRLIKLLSYVGDTVLDPFSGIGTTAVAAKLLKRTCCGSSAPSSGGEACTVVTAPANVGLTMAARVASCRDPTSTAMVQPMPVAPKSCTVLLVDDHADTLNSLTVLLTRKGHLVLPAKDYSTALSVADMAVTAEVKVDLIISDVGLPDGDGVELMRELKRRLGCPAVALTGYGMTEDVQRCADAGIDRHLLKPVGAAQLDTEMRHLAGC